MERVEHYCLSCRTTVDLRLPAATQMTASLVDRIHISASGQKFRTTGGVIDGYAIAGGPH